MSTQNSDNLVYGLRLSTAVPGKVTGDGKVSELKGADLAMKLHYIRGLYFFTNNSDNTTSTFVNVSDFKNRHLFDWLETYFMTCGRVRVPSEEGAPSLPVIKFNDAGIRFVEARSTTTVEEWLAMENAASLNHLLTYNHVLGPDLPFTPLVFIQVTWFRCGGVSVGLSWSHILGDAFAASTFMKMLGCYLQGELQPKVLTIPNSGKPDNAASSPLPDPRSIKRVDPVGDCWVAPANVKMSTYSFELTQEQLAQLHSSICGGNPRTGCFELISGVIWKCIAKARKELEPKLVTICRPKSTESREQVIPYNGQVVGTVESKSKVSTTDVSELASLIGGMLVDESKIVAKTVESEISNSDFIVYGANLTFVDMEEANIYDFRLKAQQPVFASYTVGGMGDEGVIFVLPGPTHGTKLITLMLPQFDIDQVKMKLKEEWSIA